MIHHLINPMRRLATGLLVAAAAVAAASSAFAADGQLNILVPWPAGGPADTTARTLVTDLQQQSGSTVLIENIVGAGGQIGVERYARKAPAERGFLLGSPSELIATLLTSNTTKLKPEDFRLVAVAASGGFALVVRDGLPVRSFDELAAHARTLPPKALKFAHLGFGSLFHLAWKDVTARAGITALQVPYKGVPDILKDLAVGDLDVAFVPLNTAVTSFPGIRAIGMTAPTRNPFFPQLATLGESTAGRGFQYEGWFGLVVARDLPPAEFERLERLAQAAMRGNAFAESNRALGHVVPAVRTRAQIDQFYDGEVARHRALIARLGLGS